MTCMRLPAGVGRALAFNRAGLAPGRATRAALGVGLPLVIGAAAGHPADGAMAAAGALPVGVAAMSSSSPTTPTALLVTTTTGMALSTFVGSLCAGHAAAVAAALALWGFAAGLLVVLGQAATITGVQAVIGLLVFGRYPGGVGTSALHAAAVMSGGLLQTLLSVVLRPMRPLGTERAALADVYRRLSSLADGSSHGGPSGEAIASTSALLTRRAPDSSSLRDVIDEATRIRLELQALSSVPDIAGVDELRAATSTWLAGLAETLSTARPPSPEPPGIADHVRADDTLAGRAGSRQRFAAARATALIGQLRAVDRLAATLAGERRLPLPRIAGSVSVLALRGAVRRDAARLHETATDRSAPAFRHAVRLAVLLPLADVVSRGLPWPRGYWVPLTTMVVLKPDYASTMQRGVGRMVGTGLGVVLAAALIAVARPTGGSLVLAVTLLAWASYAVFAASFTIYTLALTALVVLLVSTGDPKPLSAVADRAWDTLLGGTIALIGYAVWPTREAATLRTTVSRLLAALATYADAVFDGYVVGGVDQALHPRLAEGARTSRRARADAQASLDRATAEPARLRADTTLAQSVLAGARRIVIVLHALRTTLQDSTVSVPVPEVETVGRDVVEALRQLAEAVASGQPVRMPDLRELQQKLEALADATVDQHRARRIALVAAHLDPLVDAVDTVAHMLDNAEVPAGASATALSAAD